MNEQLIRRVSLKNTGLSVSAICLGTMTFGGQTDEATAGRMVGACLDRGIDFFDTANVYTDGASETILGKVLGSKRRDVVLASKTGNPGGIVPEERGLSRAAMVRAIENTLVRLGTDYLDLYYLHVPDGRTAIEESLATMSVLIAQGKVRYAATSNYAAWQVAEMFAICEKNHWPAPFVAQPMYSLLARGIESEYLAMCSRFGISNFVFNPLAGGLLTGKQRRDAPGAGTRFDNNQMYLDRYWHDEQFDAVERLQVASEKEGRSLIGTALNWLLHHTQVAGVILGASRPEHLEQNLSALNEGPLSPKLIAAVDDVWNRLRGIAPPYFR